MRLLPLASIAALAGALTGCFLKQADQQQAGPPSGKTYAKIEDLGADKLPYTKAKLILAGTPLNVTMERVAKGEAIMFNLSAGEEVLETEHYTGDDHIFRFAGLSDETFTPAIPIARFPLTVGETWDWEGEASLGKNRKAAKASLATTSETVNLAGGVYECVVVTANLVVSSDGTDSKRTLKFWIQPQKGIVKREFGFSSTREPRAAGDS